ncbi:MAG TPA: hypothetical protein VG759_24150 [Candidatus Angelobacter sp.]|jgi:hypothetical protein|nr:hypothetical protein [Candidatus Angelobacter sp.]
MRVLAWVGAVGLGIVAGIGIVRYRQGRLAGRELLDINKATTEELVNSLGLDFAMVERIVEHRPYPSKIDLLGRMVVPPEIYRAIHHRITRQAS